MMRSASELLSERETPFWGKATTHPLQQVQFDLTTGTGTLLRTVTNTPSSAAALGVHASSNLLAMIAFQTPDNLRLYDTSGSGSELATLDQEMIPSDNANANGTGSVAVGNDRIFVLDTNNGIQAYRINAGSSGTAPTLTNAGMTAGTLSFTLTGSPNASYRIQSTSDFLSWAEIKTVTTGGDGSVSVTDTPTQRQRFYRAAAQ
jgi:hypothetical protein